jgi:hypothetical protein
MGIYAIVRIGRVANGGRGEQITCMDDDAADLLAQVGRTLGY